MSVRPTELDGRLKQESGGDDKRRTVSRRTPVLRLVHRSRVRRDAGFRPGVFYYGIGAFFTPLVVEFGWTRAATSFAISLYQLSGAFLAPAVGLLFDRLGPRKLIGVGVGAFGTGFCS